MANTFKHANKEEQTNLSHEMINTNFLSLGSADTANEVHVPSHGISDELCPSSKARLQDRSCRGIKLTNAFSPATSAEKLDEGKVDGDVNNEDKRPNVIPLLMKCADTFQIKQFRKMPHSDRILCFHNTLK